MTGIVEAVVLSDRGLVRRSNEDSQLVLPPLFVVADGMGGARGGEVASSMAIATLKELALGDGDEQAVLQRAVEEANRRIHERAQGDPSVGGMGTTVTAALARPGRPLVLAQVGDSRAYRLRGAELAQLTDDHSLVGELMRSGAITPAEAERHPQRSIITRALGAEAAVAVDLIVEELQDGDVYLLCSDGLTGMIDDDLVREILLSRPALRDAARELVRAANAAGGDDNVTVVLLRVGELAGSSPKIEVLGTDATIRSAPSSLASREMRGHRRRGLFARVVFTVVGLGLLVALVGGSVLGLRWAHFVGADEGSVAVFQGIPYDLGNGLRLYRRVDLYQDLPVATLDQPTRERLFDHSIVSVGDARAEVRQLITAQGAWASGAGAATTTGAPAAAATGATTAS